MTIYWQIHSSRIKSGDYREICDRYGCEHVVGYLMKSSEESMTVMLLSQPELIIQGSVITVNQDA